MVLRALAAVLPVRVENGMPTDWSSAGGFADTVRAMDLFGLSLCPVCNPSPWIEPCPDEVITFLRHLREPMGPGLTARVDRLLDRFSEFSIKCAT